MLEPSCAKKAAMTEETSRWWFRVDDARAFAEARFVTVEAANATAAATAQVLELLTKRVEDQAQATRDLSARHASALEELITYTYPFQNRPKELKVGKS